MVNTSHKNNQLEYSGRRIIQTHYCGTRFCIGRCRRHSFLHQSVSAALVSVSIGVGGTSLCACRCLRHSFLYQSVSVALVSVSDTDIAFNSDLKLYDVFNRPMREACNVALF